ncbi:phosphoribosylglycinamide formyltransferase [Helicobacter sp. 23-1046]
MQQKTIVILFSGNGSNMIHLINTLHQKVFIESASKKSVLLTVAGAICNNPNAKGLQRLKDYTIPCEIIPHSNLSREEFDTKLVKKITEFAPDLCVLSGFMRILTPIFTSRIKAINIHPSFLPLHKGANAITQSYQSNEDFGGVSVHWVSEELDSGDIILQEKLPKIPNESLQSFESRIHNLEYTLFPKATLQALHLEE